MKYSLSLLSAMRANSIGGWPYQFAGITADVVVAINEFFLVATGHLCSYVYTRQ